MMDRVCQQCDKVYKPTSSHQKRCGSAKKKIGCSYEHSLLSDRIGNKKRYPKQKLRRLEKRIKLLQEEYTILKTQNHD